jgi:hypothetical protein
MPATRQYGAACGILRSIYRINAAFLSGFPTAAFAAIFPAALMNLHGLKT